MVTLIVNPGSSSKKYALYRDGSVALEVKFEKTSEGFGRCTAIGGTQQRCDDVSVHMYREALQEVLSVAKSAGVIKSIADITRVVVRLVAPGVYFQRHRVIDERTVAHLLRAEAVLPLHIPPTLEEIAAVRKLLTTATLIGASDSAFHATVPEHIAQYSLRDAAGLEVKRYGYHGLSVVSVVDKLPSVLDAPGKRVVVAHIGSGVSVTGVEAGKSVYNSMGYTPASGVMMSSRAGDIDPGALVAVLEGTDTKLSGAHRYLQTNGGFAGLLGINDLRVVLAREQQDDPAATTALKTFFFDIQKQITAAAVALGGTDTLVLTATAMERNPELRTRVLAGLSFMGICCDGARNDSLVNRAGLISADTARVQVVVIPTDEFATMYRAGEEVAAGE